MANSRFPDIPGFRHRAVLLSSVQNPADQRFPLIAVVPVTGAAGVGAL